MYAIKKCIWKLIKFQILLDEIQKGFPWKKNRTFVDTLHGHILVDKNKCGNKPGRQSWYIITV